MVLKPEQFYLLNTEKYQCFMNNKKWGKNIDVIASYVIAKVQKRSRLKKKIIYLKKLNINSFFYYESTSLISLQNNKNVLK